MMSFLLFDFFLHRIERDAAAMTRCSGPKRYGVLISIRYSNEENWAHTQDTRTLPCCNGPFAGNPTPYLQAFWRDLGSLDLTISFRLGAMREFGVDATPFFVSAARLDRGIFSFERFGKLARPLLTPACHRGVREGRPKL